MICTFYSFKGGVGRSMALANIAEAFHERGLCVLAVDWDLEAPGLEAFFRVDGRNSSAAAPRLDHPGLMDLLAEYRSAYPKLQASRAAAAMAAAAHPDLERAIKRGSELAEKLLREADDLPEFLRAPQPLAHAPTDYAEFLARVYAAGGHAAPPAAGRLASSPLRGYVQCIHAPDADRANGVYLLSAGARAQDRFTQYAEAVQEFDWTGFYVSWDGAAYFSWLRTQLSAIADVVLIDSRTGVTEMGGVCTRHLPDVVVSFCAPNNQNIDGVLRVMSGVNKEEVRKARGDRHVDVLVIPTRIDATESDRLVAFSNRFAEEVERAGWIPEELSGLPRPLWSLQIPYIPRYNYAEQRVLGPDLDRPDAIAERLAEPYKRIALHLAVLADPQRDKRIRDAFAGEIAAQFPQVMGGVPQMAPQVTALFVGRDTEGSAIKAAMLRASTDPDAFIVVAGPAGIGKTMVVARACREVGIAAFPHGILWATATVVATAELARDWLGTTLGEKKLSERALREKLKERRFVIVVDDVRDAAEVRHVFSYGGACARVAITRDESLAPGRSGALIFIGPLQQKESTELVGAPAEALLRDAGAHADVLADLLRWPLGASLVRVEIDRRIAQGQGTDQIRAGLHEVFGRHGIVAFDHPGFDRSTSVARTLRDVVYGDSVPPHVRRVLVAIAAAKEGLVFEDEGTEGRAGSEQASDAPSVAPVRRLDDLGLVTRDPATGRVKAHALVRAFLVAEGELDDPTATGKRRLHVSSSQDQCNQANADVERAKAILRGQSATLDEIQRLAESLKDTRYFPAARQLFGRARAHSEFRGAGESRQLKLKQRHALCTYKDNDLPGDERFAAALEILAEADLGSSLPSQETLGQAGAIHKNMWRLWGRRRDLEQSVAFYERGHAQGVAGDYGYTGINAAFVHDLIAAQQRHDAPQAAEQHAARARAIRTTIATELPRLAQQQQHEWLRGQWWFYATLAEAGFGLARHDEARYWLREGLPTKPPDWQIESTTRQLAELAHAQGEPMTPDSNAWRTLRVLVGHAGEALRAITLGKVGLALSGGGFRASLFHVGVLARLAECDLLRHVEVLSCVSGGSIVGAHYYLEVRKLLNERPDRDITRGHYVEIVKRIEQGFLAAVQQNLRTRLFASILANLKTLVLPGYTRTEYLGRLFERHIYARVDDDGRRNLDEMVITPAGGEPFNPKLDNWRRSAKGPVLLLNATTLNTGHNWQFAVSWMGEPPLGASSPVDRNDVLRRFYYWEAPPRYQKVPLGRAVAASACVPALFDPVAMNGLFPHQGVRLVDGGVHDNQGTTGLHEQECTVMIVSDASGQTNVVERPSDEATSVPMRANDILMTRVRQAQFRELDLLRRSGVSRALVFLHLKKDLDVTQLDWVNSQDPWAPPDDARLTNTSYGIPKTVQRLLAGIRTDLDSFTDREAYTLMLSGYEMAAAELRQALPQWQQAAEQQEAWQFKAIEPVVKRATGQDLAHAELLRQLQAGAARGFKIWKLSAPLRWTAALVLAAVVAAAWVLRDRWTPRIPWPLLQAPYGVKAIVVLFCLALMIAGAYLLLALLAALFHRLLRTGKSATVLVTGLLVVPFGALAAIIHLAVFDLLFLRKGALEPAKWRGVAVKRLGIAAVIVLAATVTAVWLTRSGDGSYEPPLPASAPGASDQGGAGEKR